MLPPEDHDIYTEAAIDNDLSDLDNPPLTYEELAGLYPEHYREGTAIPVSHEGTRI